MSFSTGSDNQTSRKKIIAGDKNSTCETFKGEKNKYQVEHRTAHVRIGDPVHMSKSLLDDDLSDEDVDEIDIESGNFIATHSGNEMKEKGSILVQSFERAVQNGPQKSGHSSRLIPSVSSNFNKMALEVAPGVTKWESFVRQGATFKNLVQDTLTEVKTTWNLGNENTTICSRKRVRDHTDDLSTSREESRKRLAKTDIETVAQLVHEKTSEAINLQKLLKDAVDQSTVLKAANQSLRDEAASYQRRLEKTLDHLRIAGSNASKARTDADAAEATASNLSQSLQSIHSVVSETKRASGSLQREQQMLQNTVASVENKLLRMEAKLATSNKELSVLQIQKGSLIADIQKEKESRLSLEANIKVRDQELEELKHSHSEHQAIEDARKQRAANIERECLNAQNLLLEVTENQAKSEQNQEALNERILTLQESNQTLHAQLQQLAKSSQQDIMRLSEALFESKKEAQQLLIKSETTEEEIKRMRLEKSSSERIVSELKSHLLQYEGMKNELSAITAGARSSHAADGHDQLISNDFGTENVPPVTSLKSVNFSSPTMFGDKENDCNSRTNVTIGNRCAICFKPSVGIMKTCQCGNSSCTMRAHITCVNRIQPSTSVSHPGTPAQRLPVVLCGYIHKTPLANRTPHSSVLASRSTIKRM